MITLADLTPCDWDKLPEGPGVYVIHDEEQAVYIGQTNNVRQRWVTHHRSMQIKAHYPNATISLWIKDTDEGERLHAEQELIDALKPALISWPAASWCSAKKSSGSSPMCCARPTSSPHPRRVLAAPMHE
jgi:predicted GIY-YIG superfamily endonuclease